MTYFNIALNNLKKKFSSYLIYFISTIFSVTVFNIFCSIYYNPQFSQYRFGSGKMSILFKASAIAVILFSAVFVMYSNQFFIKTRKKEIAIYSLLGMKKRQIGMMLFYENIIMGILATACGVALGTLLSRFFSMFLLRLMAVGTNVIFTIRWQAIAATGIAFLILFSISSINAYSIIFRNKLVELLSASKEGERIPRYSVLCGLASMALIIAGYIVALTTNVNAGGFKLLLPAFFVLMLVVTGTLLFFINFVPMVIMKLKRNIRFFYRTENVISVSQILYRIKANSKTLSVIAIMIAITITLISATYSIYRGLEDTVQFYSPFSYVCKNITDEQFERILQVVKQRGEVNVTMSDSFNLIKAQGQNRTYSVETENSPGMVFDAFILSQSAYKDIIRITNAKTGNELSNIIANFDIALSDTECYFIDGNITADYCKSLSGETMNLMFENATSSFQIAGVSLHKYIGLFDLYKKPTFVVND
ncbi:MAG: ABC transporter permease, partial [Clostridia bacterium]|nr:ABC transporter permease [Clostridia bacterium]